jgi:predicted GTPase
MTATLQDIPSGERIHIGFFGRRNSGKSALANAFAGQEISIVSDQAGTTTDPVKKPMEICGLGACVLIDTAVLMTEGHWEKVVWKRRKKRRI